MKILSRIAMLALVVALVGCGKGDPTAEANKNLKPVDPSAPKPSSATAAGGAGTGGPTATAGPVK